MLRAIPILARLVLLALPLLAAGPAPEMGAPPQLPLTPATVQNYIASYEPVKALCDKYDKRWGDEDFADPKVDGLTRMRQQLEAHGARDAFDRLVGQYGFGGLDSWWATGYSTMIAYAFSDPKHDPAETKAKLDRALADLDKTPKLTAAQKAQYAGALRQSLARYAAMAPPPGNIEAVRPYRARLQALLGETGEE